MMTFKQFETDLDCITVINSIKSLQTSVSDIQNKIVFFQNDQDTKNDNNQGDDQNSKNDVEEEKQSQEDRKAQYKRLDQSKEDIEISN